MILNTNSTDFTDAINIDKILKLVIHIFSVICEISVYYLKIHNLF